MGYTHYYCVKSEFDRQSFANVVSDFVKMIKPLEHLGVKLAGPDGSGKPIISATEIAFNGVRNCGHQQRPLGITWPSRKARGVANLARQHRDDSQIYADVEDVWFAGFKLNTRTCDGDCSHESFRLEQHKRQQESDKIFDFTKTAYKPYDLAVNVALIIAKHHLKDSISVHSDGKLKDWSDAMELCQHFLGYGQDFTLED